MKKTILLLPIMIIFSVILLGSCILIDYFSGYSGKNLISHIVLSDWSASYSAPYMNYSEVTAAVAGVSGLPDDSALIYRLENMNLFPDGDFEASATGAAPAGDWDPITGGGFYEVRVKAAPHPLNGNALFFDQASGEYISYPLNSIADTAYPYNSYVIRFSMSGSYTGEFMFVIDNNSGTELSTFIPSISTSGQLYNFPEDFDTVPQTEFTIHSDDDEFFRINHTDSNLLPEGYIDDIRVVKSDQNQTLSKLLSYTDEERVDSLELISGWYRFSIYVKADPTAGTANRFNTGSVTLTIEAVDDEGLGGSSKALCFNASENSSFSSWTQIHIDANLQIVVPSSADANVIILSVNPCCTVGGALGVDAGSILISNPALEFSSTGSF